jgi:hypothetical protein
MPTSSLTFQTQGSWDTSTVTHMGNQIDCMAIKLNMSSNRFLNDRPGGVEDGVDIQDAAILVPVNEQAIEQINGFIDAGNIDACYTVCNELPIFPGEISIINGTQDIRVVFDDPHDDTTFVRVFLEGVEITQDFCDLQCEINYIENIVRCNLTITTNRRLLSHDNETITIL